MPLPRLTSGQLRDRIQIRRETRTADGEGGWRTSWMVIATPWAEVQGQDGREAVIARALQGVSVYRIRMRYRDGITAADQILYRGVDLNIRSASDPNGDREQLVILADTASSQRTG